MIYDLLSSLIRTTCPSPIHISARRVTLAMLSASSLYETVTLRMVWTLPFSSVTMTGMVLFPSSTRRTRFRSVVSSAVFSERIASAHIAILFCSSTLRSLTRIWDAMSDAAAIITATATNAIFT